MRTQPLPGADDTGFRGLVREVYGFFFRPCDTATLGLIRICAGFLILYVHLIYSLDLLGTAKP